MIGHKIDRVNIIMGGNEVKNTNTNLSGHNVEKQNQSGYFTQKKKQQKI